VVTEWDRYFGNGRSWLDIFKIWNGGLGILGGIAGGAIGVWVFCKVKHLPMAGVADVFAPTLLLAQAIGRLGNWFNQEVFGTPTELPWGLEIDVVNRPVGYADYATFHPTFLYEGLWNVLGIAVLFLVARASSSQRGKVFTSYLLWYTFGRFFIELIRIDPVNAPGGIRVNNWTSAAVFIVMLCTFIFQLLKFPGGDAMPFTNRQDSEANDTDSTAQPRVADEESSEVGLTEPIAVTAESEEESTPRTADVAVVQNPVTIDAKDNSQADNAGDGFQVESTKDDSYGGAGVTTSQPTPEDSSRI
jgi:hypothetical protein